MNERKKTKKVLVVVDMQNDFINGSLGNDMTKKVLPKVVNKLKETGKEYDYIFFTRDVHYDDYMETLEGQKLPVPHCISKTEGAKIPKELWDVVEELRKEGKFVSVVNKHTFGSKNLMEELYKIKGKEFIEFCGVCTDICVVSNAIGARMSFPNTIIKVDAECCAGTTIGGHYSALKIMNNCHIDISNN